MRLFLLMLTGFAGLLQNSAAVRAQSDEGFTQIVPAATEGDERARQNSLWVMEVHLKPMRLIWVDIKNPETGVVAPELFHYLAYRAIVRPLPVTSVKATEPVNQTDPEPGPPMFIPEFTLIAEDADPRQIFTDQIVPEALAAINRKERRKFKNSVTLAGPILEATTEAPNNENAVYGVAIFRGVDPDFDLFTLFLSGFSNGYQATPGPDGETLLMRKTIEQRFWRPGDRFEPTSAEFQFQGEPRWMYRPDASASK